VLASALSTVPDPVVRDAETGRLADRAARGNNPGQQLRRVGTRRCADAAGANTHAGADSHTRASATRHSPSAWRSAEHDDVELHER
jgi:hypothetical protein